MSERRWEAVRLGVLLAVTTAILTVSWLSFTRPSPGLVEVGRIVGLALLPALSAVAVRRALAGVAALPVALVLAAGLALGVPITEMRPGERDYFGPLVAAVGDGFDGFYRNRMPVDPAEQPEMAGLVLLALFLFVSVTALLLAARRPLVAGLLFIAGTGWPATIEATIPGASPLRTGAIFLACVLLLLFLTREGRPLAAVGAAVMIGAALVAAAVGASTSSAVAKSPFLESWRSWNWNPDPEPVGVRYVWASNYSGIRFPREETVVLRVKAPERALYWRATTLDEFTGLGWREALQPTGAPSLRREVGGLLDPSIPTLAKREANWTKQTVTIEALADTHLVGASTPVRWELAKPASVQYARGGVVLVPKGLEYGQRYTVWSYAPSVRPKLLAELPPRYPSSLNRYLEVLPGLALPAFGSPLRDELDAAGAAAFDTGDPLVRAYLPLLDAAREVAGDARSPYVVAATLELWFRSEGGFRYEEQPEQPLDATPPLVDFVTRTKEGYCQHYAGAMALMLRWLGIPARVAAGFTSGTYDANRDEWVVTNHNAHTWVEVWFPKYGWLSFDPTPGRGRLAASYSATSETFNQSIQQLASSGLGLTPTLARIANIRGASSAGTAPARTPSAPPTGPTSGGVPGGVVIAAAAVGSIVSLAGLVAGLKWGRRRLRYLGKDPRRIASACREDLVAFLADYRVSVTESLTLDELRALLRRQFGVDAAAFAVAAEEARFGPPPTSAAAAARARRELRRLEREIHRQQSWADRARSALSLRSLTV